MHWNTRKRRKKGAQPLGKRKRIYAIGMCLTVSVLVGVSAYQMTLQAKKKEHFIVMNCYLTCIRTYKREYDRKESHCHHNCAPLMHNLMHSKIIGLESVCVVDVTHKRIEETMNGNTILWLPVRLTTTVNVFFFLVLLLPEISVWMSFQRKLILLSGVICLFGAWYTNGFEAGFLFCLTWNNDNIKCT